jgi:hypothetical protein
MNNNSEITLANSKARFEGFCDNTCEVHQVWAEFEALLTRECNFSMHLEGFITLTHKKGSSALNFRI